MISNVYQKNFNPNNIALIFKDQSITYSQLDLKVQNLQHIFQT
jgi:hypothetical protein